MTILESAVRNLLAQYPDILYGFADISYSPLAQDYSSALVLAVPHGKQLTPESYTESDFDAAICSSRDRLEAFLEKLESLLKEQKAVYYIPPMAQKNETDLLAEFSYKYAATRAGVGWIGRNDVVITERYGPRVRLSAVLINAPLTHGEPITESRCPENCRRCVEICPCKALKNVRWDAGKLREEIIDFHRCNKMRSAFIRKLGRKSACGLCMAACPFGTPEKAE